MSPTPTISKSYRQRSELGTKSFLVINLMLWNDINHSSLEQNSSSYAETQTLETMFNIIAALVDAYYILKKYCSL